MLQVNEYMVAREYNTTSLGNQGKFELNNRWYKMDDIGYEGLAEVVTSNLLKKTNIESFVLYKQEQFQYKGEIRLGCSSENFKPEGCQIITADRIFRAVYGFSFHEIDKEKTLENSILSFVDKLSTATKIDVPILGKYLTEMIELDAFTLNCDRHFNNIAFIRQNNIFTPAPIFDNGAAFLSHKAEEMDKDIDEIILNLYAKPFSYSLFEQKEMMESLFGHHLEFSHFEIEEILPKELLYPKKYAERILDILEYQKDRYPELFVENLEYRFAKAKDECRGKKEEKKEREREIEAWER